MRLRPEFVVFCVAVVGGWMLASSLGLSAAQQAGAAGPGGREGVSIEGGRTLLKQGAESLARNDPDEADRAFRRAWLVAGVREAAKALRDLHRRPGYKLTVDEEALSKTMALLGQGFVRHETQNFVILSDAGRDWTLNKAGLLERAQHQFFRVMERLDYPAIPPEHKLQCVLFRDHAMYMSFARAHDGVEAPWIAGYYAGLSNRVVFYDDRTGPTFARAFDQLSEAERTASDMRAEARAAKRERHPEEAENLAARAEDLTRRLDLERGRLQEQVGETSDAKTIHEAIHLLAFNCGVQSRARQYPFWLTEGLAMSFETDSPDNAFGPDHGSDTRQAEFEAIRGQHRLFDLETLVQLNTPPDHDAETADVMYSQSYSLFQYLFRYERKGLGAYLSDIWAEPAGSVSPRRHFEMFQARFGDPTSVERRWLKRVGNRAAAGWAGQGAARRAAPSATAIDSTE